MGLIAASNFFQERACLIRQLSLKIAPKKGAWIKVGDRIFRIWRLICEFFRPNIYQKRIGAKLKLIQKQLINDEYQKNIQKFYEKFVQEIKNETLRILSEKNLSQGQELEKLFQLPLDTKKSIDDFLYQLKQSFDVSLPGKLSFLLDCFEWKEKMNEQRQEVIHHVTRAKIKKTTSYDQISFMIKEAKQLMVLQKKDTKSYAYFMSKFTSSLSDSIRIKALDEIEALEYEKNKQVEKYQIKRKKISDCKKELKNRVNPSVYRLNILKKKFNFVEQQLQVIKAAFLDFYGEWLNDMKEITTNISSSICSKNFGILFFWKKKLQSLLKNKAALGRSIDVMTRLDRICLNLKSVDDFNGRKLVNSGLSTDLEEAITYHISELSRSKEWAEAPTHIHDMVHRLMANRIQFLKMKTEQFLSLSFSREDEERLDRSTLSRVNIILLEELEKGGLKKQPIQKGVNCMFDACMVGIQNMDSKFKTMDAAQFREAVYEHIKNHKEKYIEQLRDEMKIDFLKMAFMSIQLFEDKKSMKPLFLHPKYDEIRRLIRNNLGDCVPSPDEARIELFNNFMGPENSKNLEDWLLGQGIPTYLNAMGKSDAFPNKTEIKAASDLLNLPIRIFSESYSTQHYDVNPYPSDRTKALHLIQSENDYDVLIPVELLS